MSHSQEEDKKKEGKTDGEMGPISFEKKKRPIRRQYHDGWVTKVGFVDDLQAMVTSGLDGDVNLCNVLENKRKTNQPAIKLHKKYGVHAWCWCKLYKFFASGGLDRHILCVCVPKVHVSGVGQGSLRGPLNKLRQEDALVTKLVLRALMTQASCRQTYAPGPTPHGRFQAILAQVSLAQAMLVAVTGFSCVDCAFRGVARCVGGATALALGPGRCDALACRPWFVNSSRYP